MGGAIYTKECPSVHPSLKIVIKSVMLCASLFLLWYIIMMLINWYNPGLHLFATFSSVILVSTGKSWG